MKICNVKSVGKRDVYDITVSQNHNFIANGVVVHNCGNYEITRAIGKIDNPRLLVQTSSEDREKIVSKHVMSPEPTVIVSPSMMEGLDLYDDLGRFQIICKVPFPYIGDPIVKKLMEKSQKWYSWRTALSIVQSVGRCVRNENDWAHTYILDENFGSFFVRWSSFFTAAFAEMEIDESALIDNVSRSVQNYRR